MKNLKINETDKTRIVTTMRISYTRILICTLNFFSILYRFPQNMGSIFNFSGWYLKENTRADIDLLDKTNLNF